MKRDHMVGGVENELIITLPGRMDRAALAAATYPSSMTLPVRFDDLDVMWHVNNAAAVVMLQEARVRFTMSLSLPKLEPLGLRTVVGAMSTDYAAEINFPGDVEIASGILQLGRSSFTFAQLIRQDGAGCVYALTTMVVSGQNGAEPIPETLRRALCDRAMIRASH